MHAKRGETMKPNRIASSPLPLRGPCLSRRHNKHDKSLISKTAKHSQISVTENYYNHEVYAMMATRQSPALSQTLQQTSSQMP